MRCACLLPCRECWFADPLHFHLLHAANRTLALQHGKAKQLRIVRAVPSDPDAVKEEGAGAGAGAVTPAQQQSVVGVRILEEAVNNIVEALRQWQEQQSQALQATGGAKVGPSQPLALPDV